MDKKKKAEERAERFARFVKDKDAYYQHDRMTVTKPYTAYTKRGVVKVSIRMDGSIKDSIDGLQLDIESALGQQ